MIVTDERVARFVSAQTGVVFCPPFSCLGIERDGEVIAGVIVNIFEGPSCHVSAAGSGWTLGFMRALGNYIYGQLGCIRFTLTTESEAVARYAERLGGKREGVLRSQLGPGRDAIIVGVLRDEYAYRVKG